jgi:small-conductance mechanosensitive channel
LLIQACQKFYQSTLVEPLHQKVRYFFGYKQNQNLTEFFILKLTLQIIVIIFGLYAIGENMGYISYYITKLYQPLFEGITLGNVTLHPARITCGIIIFCLLFLMFRSVSTAITRHYQFDEEEDTQVALASILNYIGFAIALITGLLVAGFDFTGLAIVAGALSVGIGLGLQSIVNNFVSGLILLIEKPIKPGDRINVDGVEGTVKKIRVRSTQIITSAREDIIVPNSDLVTRRVTNYMFSDKYLSIFCRIPVPYDADVELVQKLLIEAAQSHEEVVKSGRNKPNVLLKSFGEIGLIFELWCLIKDANKKSSVQSELNYSILKLLNQHQIEIPIPQQHLYLHALSHSQNQA